MTESQTTIGEIAHIFDGPHATPKKIDSGPYFLSISSLIDGRLDLSKSAFLSEECFIKWTKRVTPQENDLLFSYETRLGQAALMPNGVKACLGRRMGLLRPNLDKVLPQYLLYAYLSPHFQQVILRNTVTGATVDRIALSEMADFPIRIPPLNEQKVVADLLESIDKKIEINNKINAELEAMAKLIYDYWFVQFDFPDSNGKPYKSSGGKMVYNKDLKREIPDGWNNDYIENLLSQEIKTKKVPKTEYQNKGSIPVIDQSTKYICGYTNDEDTLITTEVPRIVFGDHTRILKLINFDFARGADGTQVLLSNDKRVPQHFFYHSLLKIDLSNYGYARHFKFLKQSRIIIPSYDISSLFEQKMISFYEQIKHNVLENNELTELRNWLLPMLINGQVTIKDT